MVLCEHFIFTSVDLEEKSGYQIVSKSVGITSELVSDLEGYLYPVGIDPSRFSESKSMLLLRDKVVFTKAKNIGIGYDGRPDTVYSHTIVTSVEDFKKLQNDTRIFEKYYLEIKKQEHLTPLVIEATKLQPDFSCIDALGIAQFEDFLKAVFSKKKIAILNTENKNLIQSLISLLPPSFRLISFSTFVVDPKRQSKFALIQTQSSKSSLEKYFIIDPNERKLISTTKDTLYDQYIGYLIDIINSKNSTKLKEIYDQFESIPTEDYKEKLSLAVGISMLDPKQPLLLDQNAIHQLLLLLDKSPPSFVSMHYPKFIPHLPEDIATAYSRKFETSRILSHYSKEDLTSDTIVKMFNEMSNGTRESRLSLFHQLVEKSTKGFERNGHKILIELVNDFYNLDVIRGFVENTILYQCIFKALEDSTLEHKRQKRLFEMLVESSLCHNTNLLEKLFTFKVFNLNNDDDAGYYREIIVELFKAIEFHKKLEPKTIFNIINQIHGTIDPEFPRNKESGTIDKKFYHMQDILYVLLNTMRYLLSVRKFELSKKLEKQIQEKENNLTYFLDLNRLPETRLFPPFAIFSPVLPPLIRILFSSFSKRCKDS